MRIHTARKVINEHSEKLQKRLQQKLEENGGDIYAVTIQDPFFAGQIYALSMLMLELNAIEVDEQIARDLRRASRPRS